MREKDSSDSRIPFIISLFSLREGSSFFVTNPTNLSNSPRQQPISPVNALSSRSCRLRATRHVDGTVEVGPETGNSVEPSGFSPSLGQQFVCFYLFFIWVIAGALSASASSHAALSSLFPLSPPAVQQRMLSEPNSAGLPRVVWNQNV